MFLRNILQRDFCTISCSALRLIKIWKVNEINKKVFFQLRQNEQSAISWAEEQNRDSLLQKTTANFDMCNCCFLNNYTAKYMQKDDWFVAKVC